MSDQVGVCVKKVENISDASLVYLHILGYNNKCRGVTIICVFHIFEALYLCDQECGNRLYSDDLMCSLLMCFLTLDEVP